MRLYTGLLILIHAGAVFSVIYDQDSGPWNRIGAVTGFVIMMPLFGRVFGWW